MGRDAHRRLSSSIVALAVLFDLVVVCPLVFSLFVLRPAQRSPLEAAPVLSLGALVAGGLLAAHGGVKLPLAAAGALAEIAMLAVVAVDDPPRAKGTLRAALGTAPVLLVTLTRPVVARGLFGMRRSVSAIALYVDEPGKLRAALEAPAVSR